MILPVVVSILTTYALEPVVRALTKIRIPRVLAAAITILSLYGLIGFTAYNLRNRAAAVVESLPGATQRIEADIVKLFRRPSTPGPVQHLQQAAKEIEKTAEAVAGETPAKPGVTKVQVEAPSFNLQSYLLADMGGIFGLIGQALVMSFLIFFLLASGDLYKRKLVHLIGDRLSHKRSTVDALQEISAQIERFLQVQVFTSVIVGLATWLLLLWMDVANAAIWGVFAGVLNSVPYFGAIIVSAGLALVAFLQFGTFWATVQVSLGAFAITSLEGMLLTPVLMGKVAGINQVALFISLLFWGTIWGVPGTLLAVPIMMVIKIVCERVEGLQAIGELLSEGRESA